MAEDVNFFEYNRVPKKKRGAIESGSLRETHLTFETYPEVFSLSEKYHLNLPRISILHSKTPQAYAWPSLSVTKGLINLLNEKELFATLLHEVGHRKTGWRFFDYTVIPLYFAGMFYLTILLMMGFTVWNFLSLVIFRVLFSAPICAIQRKIELKADSYAAEILGDDREWLSRAIKKTCDSIQKDFSIFDRLINYLAFWPFKTHPPVEKRFENINRRIQSTSKNHGTCA